MDYYFSSTSPIIQLIYILPSLQYINNMQEHSPPRSESEQEDAVENSPPRGALQIYQFQVSGKTPKYTDNVHGTILKLYTEQQYQFYEFIRTIPPGDPRSMLKPFIPQYYGTKEEGIVDIIEDVSQEEGEPAGSRSLWLQHIHARSKSKATSEYRFIILKNLTFGWTRPVIMDLKLGIKKAKKSNEKYQKTTTNSHKFRINGLVVALKEGEGFTECFMSKYHGQTVTVQQTQAYLALFFFDGERINLSLLQTFLTKLDELIIAFRNFTGVHFISSSLFLAYDALDPSHYTLNLIDFDKYEHTQSTQPDTITEGLNNIRIFLKSALAHHESIQAQLRARELSIFQESHEVVPEQKLAQYGQQ